MPGGVDSCRQGLRDLKNDHADNFGQQERVSIGCYVGDESTCSIEERPDLKKIFDAAKSIFQFEAEMLPSSMIMSSPVSSLDFA